MALTVRQAIETFLGERGAGAGEALERLLVGVSHAPGASPTRTNPAFPRRGAAGSPLGEVWIYELGADDVQDWLEQHPGDRAVAVEFVLWLWRQGMVGADRYEDLRERLGLPPDDEVRRRRLHHRLVQVAGETSQHLQENLLNPTLYLGLPSPTAPPQLEADLEGELVVERAEGTSLWGHVGDTAVGPLPVGAEAVALARPGDRLLVSLARGPRCWRVLAVEPAGW